MQSNLGVYSEVRGKYARPAPQLNQTKHNPILNRPTTAGSLRPRTNKLLHEERLLDDKEEIFERPKSSLDFCMKSVSSRRSKRSRRSVSRSEIVRFEDRVESKELISAGGDGEKLGGLVDSHNLPLIKKQENVKFADPPVLVPAPLTAPAPGPEPPLSPNSPDLIPSPPPSTIPDTVSNTSTYKTTSSHRRYITELEQLLHQEQKKREQLEELLHSLISNNPK